MAQVTQLQPNALPGKVRTFSAKTASVVWASLGDVFKYVSANYGSQSIHFEVFYKATAGTAEARLYNETAATAVVDSAMTTTSGSFVRERSGALSLTDGDEYRAQFGSGSVGGGEAVGAKLVIL